MEHFADCIEQPTMRVDLLLVLGLDDQNELNGNEIVRIFGLWENKSGRSINRQLSGVLGEIVRV